jgi:hypothetical protein
MFVCARFRRQPVVWFAPDSASMDSCCDANLLRDSSFSTLPCGHSASGPCFNAPKNDQDRFPHDFARVACKTTQCNKEILRDFSISPTITKKRYSRAKLDHVLYTEERHPANMNIIGMTTCWKYLLWRAGSIVALVHSNATNVVAVRVKVERRPRQRR